MNWNDLIIIYLACGAPFAVYYFLQNRNLPDQNLLWPKTILRFVFWIPFGFLLVARRYLFTKLYTNVFDVGSILDAKKVAHIVTIQKNFEKTLLEGHSKLSIYEFREIFERYTGLTLELQNDSQEISEREQEIFRVTNHGNKKLAGICLHRRNRQRLIFHQNLARRDFFELFEDLVKRAARRKTLFDEAAKLFFILRDFESQKTLEILLSETLQTQEKSTVKNLEKELWNSEKQKPLPANQITATNLQVIPAAANLSRKD